MEKRNERSLAPRWAALACVLVSAATCGDQEQEAEPGMMDGMPGTATDGEMDTPMVGGDQMQMMQQMRMHMQQMSSVSADSLMEIIPMHRQMAGQMLAGMDQTSVGRGMQMDSTWSATMDSVRSDLARIEGMSAQELEELMPAHRTRLQRLMSMHDSVMGVR
jgi:hypothetical protein